MIKKKEKEKKLVFVKFVKLLHVYTFIFTRNLLRSQTWDAMKKKIIK